MKTLRLFQSPRQQDSGSQGLERREDGDRGRRARDERKRRGSGRAREKMGKKGERIQRRGETRGYGGGDEQTRKPEGAELKLCHL